MTNDEIFAADEEFELRLLIVDDDADFADSLAEILEPRGYRINVVHSAQSALEAAASFAPHVALIDIRLGRNSGIDLIARLGNERKGLLCVMMTAYAAVDNAIKALQHGAYDYLRKPLNAHDLFATLDRCFEKLRLERDKERAEMALRARNEELEQINVRLRGIVESSRGLAFCSHWADIGPLLLEEFAGNMTAVGGSLFLRDEDGLVLAHSIDPGHAPSRIGFPLREGSVFDQAISKKEPVLIRDIGQESGVQSSGSNVYRDGSLLVFPLPDEQGEIVGVISLHNKLTPPFTPQDRELGSILASYGCETIRASRAVQALRESEEKYRTILENIKEGYFEVDLQGNFTFFNDAMCEILGFSRDELMGKESRNYTDSETAKTMNGILEGIYHTAEPSLIVDHEIIRKDGSTGVIEMSIFLLLDSQAQPKGCRGVVRDITDRKRAEEERQRLATAVEQAAESIIITDRNGIILYVNPACEYISGYGRDEVIGEHFRCFRSDRQEDGSYESIMNTIMQGEFWSGHLVNRRKDGSSIEFETTISPIRDKTGSVISFVIVNRDVTHEIELEKQLIHAQKMEAVGTLAGGIAHDFNNLLQAVLGYAELLLMGKKEEDPSFRELYEIFHAAKRGSSLTQQLLTFSRKVESQKHPLSLNHQVLQVKGLLERVIPKMIAIELHLASNLNIINADPNQIEQLLMNMAVNAKDAMPGGGVLSIKTENVTLDAEYCKGHLGARPGQYVVLTISDTGHGMDRETMEHIFEPFFSTKGPGRGTGLGLAMVYGIVETHDGHVTCHSAPGEGTAFKIFFPVIERVKARPKSLEVDLTLSRGNETILVVDDEGFVRDLAQRILSTFGYKVLTAESGESALDLYRKEAGSIDVVILDLIMPQMGGKRCLEELLKIDPQVKVIIATGYAPTEANLESTEAGARGFISKPFAVARLLQTLRAVLDGERNDVTPRNAESAE